MVSPAQSPPTSASARVSREGPGSAPHTAIHRPSTGRTIQSCSTARRISCRVSCTSRLYDGQQMVILWPDDKRYA